MSRIAWHDEDGLAYYELVCTACGRVYDCHDDSGYDWRLLRDQAAGQGWDTRDEDPSGWHRCPACQPAPPRPVRTQIRARVPRDGRHVAGPRPAPSPTA
jgi:hypothetical protein